MNTTSQTKASIPKSRWFRIIPIILLIYIVASLDRNNIGFAISGGMDETLNLTATVSGLVSGVFFIGYLVLQVPGGIIAEKKNAQKYVAWTVIAFGVMSVLSGLAQNSWQMLASRFLLGVSEGGLFPAMLIIITRWFPNEERGKANSVFLMNSIFAGIIGGPLAGALMSVWSWRELFISEGIISLLLLLFVIPLLKNRPEDANWLPEAEKEYITTKMREEQNIAKDGDVDTPPLKQIIKNKNVWKLVIIFFCMSSGIYGFTIWLPEITKQLTNSGIGMVGLLTALPNIAALLGNYTIGALSDKSDNRKFYLALPLIGFAFSITLSNVFHNSILISFIFLVICGFFLHSAAGVMWTIPPLIFTRDVAAASRGFINALGNLGGFLGPFIVGWLASMFNSYIGFYSLVVLLLIGFFATLTLPKITSARPDYTKKIYETHVP